MTLVTADVRPGDWFVTDPGALIDKMILGAEFIADGFKPTRWAHAGICSRITDGTLWIVQAEPGGAQEVPWPWEDHPHAWCKGVLAAGAMARKYIGTPYSFLDYAALGLHAAHIPAPHLREYVASTGHMICSQLVDQAELDAGNHLFTDGRWPGYVKPSDLGRLIPA